MRATLPDSAAEASNQGTAVFNCRGGAAARPSGIRRPQRGQLEQRPTERSPYKFTVA